MKYFEKCVYIIVFIGQSTEAKLTKKINFIQTTEFSVKSSVGKRRLRCTHRRWQRYRSKHTHHRVERMLT